MNQTQDQIQTLQQLYELSLAIGTSLNLQQTAATSLTAFLEKLNCTAGGIYQLVVGEQAERHYTAVHTIPLTAAPDETYQAALNFLRETAVTDLPLTDQGQNGQYYHLLELPAFGAMILVKENDSLNPSLLPALQPVLQKLATACNASVTQAPPIEAHLSEALKIAKLGYWDYDVEKDLFTFNDQFYALFHTTAEQHGGYRLSSAYYAQHFVHPDDRALVGTEIGLSLSSTDRYYTRFLEHRVLYADGGIGYISVNVNLERDEEGNILRFHGANQDITERKLAEESLRRSEAHLSEALKIAKLGYWEYDAEKDLFTFNDQFYALFHTTAEQHGGYRLPSAYYAQHFVHPDDRALVGSEIGQSLSSTDRYSTRFLEHRVLYADGGIGYISVNVNLERDEEGKILRFYGANQDITERKLAEETLRRSEAHLSEALKIAKLGYWEYDAEKDLFTFNDQFYALFHTTAEQHGGYRLPSAYYAQHFVHPDDRALVGNEIGQSLSSTDRYYTRFLEHRVLFADGGIGYISVNVNLERDEEGKILRFYGANQDITERKLAQEAITKQARELQIVAELSTAVATTLEQERLLQEVVDLTKERFGLYHAHIYLLNAQRDALVLASGAGDVGRQLVQKKHVIRLDLAQSLVVQAALTGEAVVVNDVLNNPHWLPNELLPETRAEMAIPMAVGGRVIGILDVQAREVDWFTEQDVQIQTTLAAQVSIALENARSFEQAQRAISEMNALTRRLTREGWEDFFENASNRDLRFLFDGESVREPEDKAEILAFGQGDGVSIIRSIEVNGVPIGSLTVLPEEEDSEIEAVVGSVMQQLGAHVENLRLTEQVQTALAQTEALYTGSERLVLSNTEDDVLQALIQSTELRNLDRANLFMFDQPVEDGGPRDVTVVAFWEDEDVPNMMEVGMRFLVQQVPFLGLLKADSAMIIKDIHHDARVDEATRQIMASFGMSSFVLFPLVAGSQWLGIVAGQSANPLQLDEVQLRQTKSLIAQAAVVMQTTLLFRQEQARSNRERLLREIATKVRSSTDIDTIMRTAVTEIGRTLGRRSFIQLGNGESGNDDENGATE